MTTTIDRLLATPNWGWRFDTFKGKTKTEEKAAATLREKADKARNWLAGASRSAGLELPLGNGTNGPWNRVAVSDGARLAILDIAQGVLHITDAVLPEFVRLFVVTASGRASSPHDAGGSGSLPSGWGQIPLILYGHTVPTEMNDVKIVERVWGFRTCYGTTGVVPEQGVTVTETDLPQWEDFPEPREVDPAAWEALMGTSEDIRLKPGYLTIGNIQLHTVAVYGVPAHRKARLAELHAKWLKVAGDEANKVLRDLTPNEDLKILSTRLQAVVRRRDQLGLPRIPNLPSGRSGWDNQFSNVHAVRHALAFLGLPHLMPADPATPEHMAVVARLADALLAVPPKEMALRLRDPWGVPAYMAGANRASYLIQHVDHPKVGPRRDYTYDEDVEDYPGVAAYRKAVQDEIEALKTALFPNGRPEYPSEETSALLTAAGWTVSWTPTHNLIATPPGVPTVQSPA